MNDMNDMNDMNYNLDTLFSGLSINLCKLCKFKVENNNDKFCKLCSQFLTYHFKNCQCIYCR